MSVETLTAPNAKLLRIGVVVVVALVVAVIAFDDSLVYLVRRWMQEEEYSHGFLIPVVSAWLLWTRRATLVASIGRPSWTGVGLIVLAIAMHIVGKYSSLYILSQLGFILVLIGLSLAIGGYSLLKVTFIPIAFLVFAIPLPYFIESKLTLQLQLISSQLGVEVIRLFQIPVYLEGNLIDLGNYKLQVIEACSGLRYLYPLLSLSFLAAYLFQAPIWQRVIVFLSAIPITIAMNGLRIGMVGVTVDRWGPQMADGVLHFFEGWIIFVACAIILVVEIFLLTKLSGRTFFEAFRLPESGAKSPAKPSWVPGSQAAAVTSVMLLFAAGLAAHLIAQRSEAIPERARFASFPVTIGEWQGHPTLMDEATEKALGLDDYIMSDYAKPNGKAVNFYVAYYRSQRNGYAPHSPLVCIPGGGWLITHLERANYDVQGGRLPFNRVIVEREGQRQLIYYWFDERGRKIADEYWAKWYLLADAITKNRTDGSLIRLITVISPDEPERAADARLQSFMRDMLPSLGAFLPLEQKGQPRSVVSRSSVVQG